MPQNMGLAGKHSLSESGSTFIQSMLIQNY